MLPFEKILIRMGEDILAYVTKKDFSKVIEDNIVYDWVDPSKKPNFRFGDFLAVKDPEDAE